MSPIRPTRLASVAAVTALALTACGNDGADDQQLDSAGAETTETTETTMPAESSDEPADEPSEAPTEQGSEADLPDGWTLAEADEFSIGLPPGWFNGHRAVNDEEFMAEVADQLEGYTDAELASSLEESISDIDLLAFKTEDFDSGFSTNINVGVQSRGPFDDIEPLREMAPSEIEKAGATSVETDDHEVNGMPSLQLSYDLPDFGAKGIQDYLLAEDVVIVATYTAAEPDPELWQSVLETVEVQG